MLFQCPQCQQSTPLDENSILTDVHCPSCGAFADATSRTVTFLSHNIDETSGVVRRDGNADSTPAALVGDYERLDEIARGGMGVVYRARQKSLNRIVALKMIKSGELANDEEIQRFHAEAEAAAALDHPNIVPIFEVGEWQSPDGGPAAHFFSMGFIDGESLADKLKNGPLAPAVAAGLLRTIARAVQHAHEQGIIHRDLKPSNVLLQSSAQELRTHTQEPPVDLSAPTLNPKITDFGLAKNIAADSGMTATGQVLGTPSYMPPEQAAGNVENVGPLADVYALGAMLYATLTGRPPFQASNVMETLKQVLEQQPVSPRQLNRDVDRDLETICLKCLEKDPLRRYASAGEFAVELGRFLAGKPIQARPVGRMQQLWRWSRRNPVVSTLSVGFVAALIGGTVFSLHFASEAQAKAITLDTRNAELRDTNKRMQTANSELRLSLQREELARKTVEDKERLANRNLDQSVNAVETMLLEVVDNPAMLRNTQGVQTVRTALLAAARSFLESFIRENQNANLTPRLAHATQLLGVSLFSAGDFAGSLKAFNDAGGMYERLLAADAESVEYRWRRARCAGTTGSALLELGRLDEALVQFQTAERLMWNVVARKANARHQRDLAGTLYSIGRIELERGDFSQAVERFQSASTLGQSALSQAGNAMDFRSAVAKFDGSLGFALFSAGRLGEAEKVLVRSRQRWDQLDREYPDMHVFQSGKAKVRATLGRLYRATRRRSMAKIAYRDAIAIFEKLVAANPKIDDYRTDLASANLNLGYALKETGDHRGAEQHYQRAAELWEQLSANRKGVTNYLDNLASAYNNLGVIYTRTSMPKAAQMFGKVVATREKLVAENDMVLIYREGLFQSLINLALAKAFLNEFPAAQAALDKARSHLAVIQKRNSNKSDLSRFALNFYRGQWVTYVNEAMLLSTSPDAHKRDGQRAVAVALKSCRFTRWGQDESLVALACAYAETGDFSKALNYLKRGIAMAPQKKSGEREAMKKLFESKKPYRSSK